MKSPPSFIRLQIAEDAKSILEKQADRHGMSQTELASRLVTWLVKQPPLIQAAVLNNISSTVQEDLSKALLARAINSEKPAAAKRSRSKST